MLAMSVMSLRLRNQDNQSITNSLIIKTVQPSAAELFDLNQ